MTSIRNIVNFVGKLRQGGRTFESPHEVKEEVVHFFEDLYNCVGGAKPKLEGLSFPTVFSETQTWLKRVFNEDEVLRSVEECGGDKAPGPDGLNFNFIKVGGGILLKRILVFSSMSFIKGAESIEMNTTFIKLIPKVPNPVELKDYSPISLVGCLC